MWHSTWPLSEYFVRKSIEIPRFYLLLLALFSLVGAIQVHGLMRALFGREGPGTNPKLKHEAYRRMVAIVLWKEPEHLPHSRSKWDFVLSSAELIEGKRDLLRVTKRTIALIPAFSLKYSGYLAGILLISLLVFGDAGFIAGLVTFSLFALFFRDRIWSLFPTVEPPSSETGLVKAEFERDPYEFDGRNLGEPLQKNGVSIRYRPDDQQK